jgi:4-hydroxymandelate oxidase
MTPVDFPTWAGEHQMLSQLHQAASRRLLQFLAASPPLAHGAMPAFAQGTTSRPADPLAWAPRDLNKLIERPGQALDVLDFEPVMKESVPPAHFSYMATGVDDEVTLRANRETFQRFQLRRRRLIDVSRIEMRPTSLTR